MSCAGYEGLKPNWPCCQWAGSMAWRPKVGELEASQFSTNHKLSAWPLFVVGPTPSAAAPMPRGLRRAPGGGHHLQLSTCSSALTPASTGKARCCARSCGPATSSDRSFGGAGPNRRIAAWKWHFQETPPQFRGHRQSSTYQTPLGAAFTLPPLRPRLARKDIARPLPSSVLCQLTAVLNVLTLNGAPVAYNKPRCRAGLWWPVHGFQCQRNYVRQRQPRQIQ